MYRFYIGSHFAVYVDHGGRTVHVERAMPETSCYDEYVYMYIVHRYIHSVIECGMFLDFLIRANI